MSIIRTILNNGFFILLLIVIAIIYLAYSDSIKKDHGLMEDDANDIVHATESKQTAIVEPVPSVVVQDSVSSIDEPLANETETATTTSQDDVAAVETPPPAAENNPVIEEAVTQAELLPEVVQIEKEEVQSVVEVEKVPVEIVAEEITTATLEPNQVAVENNEVKPNTENIKVTAEVSDIDVEKVLAEYKSFDEALTSARKFATAKKFAKSEEVYYSLAEKVPSAMVLGEFGNVLYQADKKKLAELSWVEAGRALIKQNNFNAATNFAKRLKGVSEKASKAILDEINVTQQSLVVSQQAKRKQQQAARNFAREAYLKKLAKYNAERKAHQDARNVKQNAYNKELQAYYKKLDAYNKAMQQRNSRFSH